MWSCRHWVRLSGEETSFPTWHWPAKEESRSERTDLCWPGPAHISGNCSMNWPKFRGKSPLTFIIRTRGLILKKLFVLFQPLSSCHLLKLAETQLRRESHYIHLHRMCHIAKIGAGTSHPRGNGVRNQRYFNLELEKMIVVHALFFFF